MSLRSIVAFPVSVLLCSFIAVIPPASAASTFDVSAGTARNGEQVIVVLTSQGPTPQVAFTDVTTGTTFNCASSSATGSIVAGKSQSGQDLATISGMNTAFNGCTLFLGLNVEFTTFAAWPLNVVRGNSSSVSGSLSRVHADVRDANGGSQCVFSLAGSAVAQYENSSSSLMLSATRAQLRVSNVRGCFGVFANGDRMSLQVSYHLTANRVSFNPVRITASA